MKAPNWDSNTWQSICSVETHASKGCIVRVNSEEFIDNSVTSNTAVQIYAF
jgi:hypothetical protein